MLENAKKQLKEISLSQAKELIKKLEPAKYEKMIINENSKIERANYYYSVLNYKVAERSFDVLKFPLHEKEKILFSKYEGGEEKFGKKATIEVSDDIYKILKFEGTKNLNIPANEIPNVYDFPILHKNNEILDQQLPYFYPLYTYSETCNNCNGHRYVTCSDCNGEHIQKCQDCNGSGNVMCKNCNGHGDLICGKCGGKGEVKETYMRNNKTYEKFVQCPKCFRSGKVVCNKCKSTGKVKCKLCKGTGQFVCKNPKCYGDKNRYGMVNCPECLTAGKTGQIALTVTVIENLSESLLYNKGEDAKINEIDLKSHCKTDLQFQTIYKNINGEIINELDEISDNLIKEYESKLKYTKNNYPMLLQEDIFYQIIPCVKITYKHMLTNTENELTIVDFWDNPEIIFLSDAEKVKTNVKSISKSAKGFFSKVLKTKKHKEKEDRKTEIKFMIYLAKSDGKIEDEEKEFLAEQITHLEDFSNSEKKEFFSLMNSVDLPELTVNDLTFSDVKKANEIIDKLVDLANADGEYELAEKNLVEKIKNLIKEKYQ